MSLGYAIAYRLGLTPWVRAGEGGAVQFTGLLAREEGGPPPHGAALDLGCGTGAHSLELAQRGWTVTGVDVVPAALRTARQQADAAGLPVRFVEADVTALAAAGIGSDFRFLLDVGCFHGLRDAQRAAMSRAITAVAADDATLLLLAFRQGRRWPLPRGAGRDDVARTFAGWTIIDEEPASTAGLPKPLHSTAPHWYRLRRA